MHPRAQVLYTDFQSDRIESNQPSSDPILQGIPEAGLNRILRDRIRERVITLRKSIDLDRIKSAGVEVDPMEFDFVYGYPPLGSLPRIERPDLMLERDAPDNLNLYIHLPFCSYSCSFCYFAKHIQSSESLIEDYLHTLSIEIRNAARWAHASQVNSIYFGGGTPTYLPLRKLVQLIELVRSSFNIGQDYEWTIEASPETVNHENVRSMAENGVNRISIGVQSFHQELLNMISRRHTVQEAIDAIRIIQESDIRRYNVDLIYGFPWQTCDDLFYEIDMIAKLGLHSVTWYQLWQRMNTPFRRHCITRRQISAEEMLSLKCLVHEAMLVMGFQRDLVDWFVKDMSYCHYQQEHKWSGADFLGLGLSAYGFMNGFYYRNYPDLQQYQNAVRIFACGIGMGSELSQDQLVRRRIMLGIKRLKGVPLEYIQDASRWVQMDLHTRINNLIKVDLVIAEDGHLRLTNLGNMYGDSVTNAIGLTKRDLEINNNCRQYS